MLSWLEGYEPCSGKLRERTRWQSTMMKSVGRRHQLQGDWRLVRFDSLRGWHMTTLMHAEELSRKPAVVRSGVNFYNLGLRDGAALAGVGGQVNGASAADKTRVIWIQEQRPDEKTTAANHWRGDDEMALRVEEGHRKHKGNRIRAMPELTCRRKPLCRRLWRVRRPAPRRRSQRILPQKNVRQCQ
jgi:hypothetical protein